MSTQAQPSDRQRLADARRWVIKVGSALLTDDGRGLDLSVVSRLADQLAALRAGGRDVVLVSSGAIVAGLARLKLSERPHEVNLLQAAAAVGQSALVRAYEECLGPHGVTTAQILLSHADVRARDRYLNARSTLNTLLSMDVLPIVNENDTVVTDEIRLGDNDTLAALVANLVDADALLILTDQDGLMDGDPRRAANAQLIQSADVHDPELDQVAGGGSTLGRGGMATKLSAARLAARSGTGTVIANGRVPGVVAGVAAGESVGTFLQTQRQPQSARKQWLASLLHAKGQLVLDDGAVRGVSEQGRSLLPIGITAVSGEFQRGDLVSCVDSTGRERARGLVNYTADEAAALIGKSSGQIEATLGYCGEEEMIHRDNLVRG
ncbi:MAG: glutamate 5-kinase [Luminiphilus sp.]|nr:glutamate 5-kinase [Luminiphilus sp.]MBL6821023.1 glutamate 5-kinase [Luminiphilus sp.]